MDYQKTILITGGAGFIGSHVVRLFATKYPDYHILCLDKLTYAGNRETLADIEGLPNYTFIQEDICDYECMRGILERYAVDGIIHLAAESHVDRSISDPFIFAKTNVLGTLSLLQAAKEVWSKTPQGYEGKRFYHISTDEVYGALELDGGFFTEETKYDPHSPYSASKASSDHFVRAFHDTYGLPTVISNCSNNYGPYQYPEKLIPLFIKNIVLRRPLPVYGTGENVRLLIKTVDEALGNPKGYSDELITYVTDRAGHDLRYAIDSNKLKDELGWTPSLQFEEGLQHTVRWYLSNQKWIELVSQKS